MLTGRGAPAAVLIKLNSTTRVEYIIAVVDEEISAGRSWLSKTKGERPIRLMCGSANEYAPGGPRWA